MKRPVVISNRLAEIVASGKYFPKLAGNGNLP